MAKTTKSNLQRQRGGQNFSSSIGDSNYFSILGSGMHLYVVVVSAVFVARGSCQRTNMFKILLPLGPLMKRRKLLEFAEITQQILRFLVWIRKTN